MKNSMRPINPGETLCEEFFVPLGAMAIRLSIELLLPATQINKVLLERGRVKANSALRLARLFDTTSRFWLSLHASFNLKQVETSLGDKIKNEIQPLKLPLKLGG